MSTGRWEVEGEEEAKAAATETAAEGLVTAVLGEAERDSGAAGLEEKVAVAAGSAVVRGEEGWGLAVVGLAVEGEAATEVVGLAVDLEVVTGKAVAAMAVAAQVAGLAEAAGWVALGLVVAGWAEDQVETAVADSAAAVQVATAEEGLAAAAMEAADCSHPAAQGAGAGWAVQSTQHSSS